MPHTIPHRELLNNSSRVLREVRAGETIAVTNHGGFSELPRYNVDESIQEDLDYLRGEW
jgi:hypothetical protein